MNHVFSFLLVKDVLSKNKIKKHKQQKPQEWQSILNANISTSSLESSKGQSAFQSRCTNRLLYPHRATSLVSQIVSPIKLVLVEIKPANFWYFDTQEEKSISRSTENTQ